MRLLNCLALCCLIVAAYAVDVKAQGFPMDSVYYKEVGVLQKSGGRKLKQWMAAYDKLNLPEKDVIRFRLSELSDGYSLTCSFRFKANYDALRDAICDKAYGPVSVNYAGSSFNSWYYPEKRIKVVLGVLGKVAFNGNANYQYSVIPMTDSELAGFYQDTAGSWQRFLVGSAPVGLNGIGNFIDKVRTLRTSVLSADVLQRFMLSPADTLFVRLHRAIPRKELPSLGQIYATPVCSVLFPFGFVGKVAKISRSSDAVVVSFVPVDELELFDIK